MKTSEFISKVESLGYQTDTRGAWIDVCRDSKLRATVFNTEFNLSVSSNDIGLMKLCIEYAETPIHERKDEKRYKVRIPDSPERTPVYALCKLVNGCVVINQTNENNFQEHDRYRLTESEIKRNHKYLWQFAKEVVE